MAYSYADERGPNEEGNAWDEHVADLKRLTFNVRDFGAPNVGGIDATAAVQTALDRAGQLGGIVHFPQGEYKISTSLLVPSGVTITGAGRASLLKLAAGADDQNVIFLNGVDHVEIANIRIDGNRDTIDPVIAYDRGACIRIADSTDIWIHHCWIENGRQGIIAGDSDCRRMTFSFNKLKDICDNGIFLRPGCAEVMIQGNYATNRGRVAGIGESGDYSGIGVIRCDNVSVIGNMVADCGPSTPQDSGGISCLGNNHLIVADNVIRRCYPNGIWIDATQEGDYDPYGVSGVTGTYRASKYVLVKGNTIEFDTTYTLTGRTGLQIYNTTDATIEGNVVTGGDYGLSVGTNIGALSSTTNKQITIRGNHFENLKLNGIVNSNAGTAGGTIVIEDNLFTNILNTGSCIYTNHPKAIIRGNTFSDVAGTGIALDGGGTAAQPHIIEGNFFWNVVLNGVLVSAASGHAEVLRNIFGGSSTLWSIYEGAAGSGPLTIRDNRFLSIGTDEYYLQNPSSATYNNDGFSANRRDKNQGAATINGTSTQTIAHGLKSTPIGVTVAIATAGGISALAVASVDATNITISFTGTATNAVVNWAAWL